LERLAPLAVRSEGRSPEVRAATGRLAFEADAEAELAFRAVHVDEGFVWSAAVPFGLELEAALFPNRFLVAQAKTKRPLAPLVPTARPNRWGPGRLPWGERQGQRGALAVAAFSASGKDDPDKLATAFLQKTDLGLDAKILARGVRVWVTSVAAAKP